MHGPEPHPDAERRAGHLRSAAAVVVVLVLLASFVAIGLGTWNDTWPLAAAGVAGLVACGLVADIVRAIDARKAAGEAASPREFESLAEVADSGFSAEQAERFWRDRKARLIWAALTLFDVGGYGAALVGSVLLAGETFTGMLAVLAVLLVPVLIASVGLHKWLDVPWMSPIPPHSAPEPADVPREVVYRPGVFMAALMPFAVAFVVLLFGAIVIGEGRREPEPAIGTRGTIVTIALTALGVACAIAIFVRSRRMRLAVGPDGVRIVNFWSSRSLRWDEIERVYAGGSLGLTVTGEVASALGDVEADVPDARGLRIKLKEPGARPIPVGVRLFADVHRHARFQQVLVALQREAEAHGVPADL